MLLLSVRSFHRCCWVWIFVWWFYSPGICSNINWLKKLYGFRRRLYTIGIEFDYILQRTFYFSHSEAYNNIIILRNHRNGITVCNLLKPKGILIADLVYTSHVKDTIICNLLGIINNDNHACKWYHIGHLWEFYC